MKSERDDAEHRRATESSTRRRARRCARRLRSRRRAACRERGEAIGATVAHAGAGFTAVRSNLARPQGYDRGVTGGPSRMRIASAARRTRRGPRRSGSRAGSSSSACPVAPPARVPPRADARARALPVPHRRGDRVHAQPARPRPDAPAAPARRSPSPSCRSSSRRLFVALLVALGTVVVSETRSAADRIDAYLTEESAVDGPDRASRSTSTGSRRGSTTTASRGSSIEEQLDDLTDSIGAGDDLRATPRTRSRSRRERRSR